jgi:hypothetical protein
MKRLLLVAVATSLLCGPQLLAAVPAGANPDSLAICCAWNVSLADDNLTYSITGGDSTAQSEVNSAIQAWPSALSGKTPQLTSHPFTMTRVFTGTADIEIRFKQGGGVIQGVTRRTFDGSGFVAHVRITISGKAFGTPNSAALIDQITKHESGHALGLDHADFNGDLMSTTLSGGSDAISNCDINGVLAAENWRFVDGSSSPALPSATSVTCP